MSSSDAGSGGTGEATYQPGWYYRSGDPVTILRWWTGLDWSEYTKTAEVNATDQAVGQAATQTQDGVNTVTEVPGQAMVIDTVTGGDQTAAVEATAVEEATTVSAAIDTAAVDTAAADTGAAEKATGSKKAAGGKKATKTADTKTADTKTADTDDNRTTDTGDIDAASVAEPIAVDEAATLIESTEVIDAAMATDPIATASDATTGAANAGFDINVAAVSWATSGADAAQYGPGSSASAAADPTYAGQQPLAGQSFPGQTFPGQTFPGQTFPGQTFPGQVPTDPAAMGQYAPYAQAGAPGQMGAPGSVPPQQKSRPLGASQLDAITGWMNRLSTQGDQSTTGWDRNLAVAGWLPGVLTTFAVLSYLVAYLSFRDEFDNNDYYESVNALADWSLWATVAGGVAAISAVTAFVLALAYALSGKQMSSFTRNHLITAFNVWVTWFVSQFAFGALVELPVGWAILLWLLTVVGVGLTTLYCNSRDNDPTSKILRLVWSGLIVVGALLTIFWPSLVVLATVPLGVAVLVLPLVNLVLARLARQQRCFALPIIPLLSKR